jgi:hypothetical protein
VGGAAIAGAAAPIAGVGLAGVCGAALVEGVMTCGVEVPVTPPIPLAALPATGIISASAVIADLNIPIFMTSPRPVNDAKTRNADGLVQVPSPATRLRFIERPGDGALVIDSAMKAPISWGQVIGLNRGRPEGVMNMTRHRFGLPIVFGLCLLGSAGFAQDSISIAPADPAAGPVLKAPAKKSAHKSKDSTTAAKPMSEADEKAARLAEGRKKFFERSMGFDNGNSDSPVTLGGSNGLTPQMGVKF